MKRFEFAEGTSNKFWEVDAEGSTVTVRFGKVGTSGQVKLKKFASADAAKKEELRLIAEKTKKGYVEASSGKRPPSVPTVKKSDAPPAAKASGRTKTNAKVDAMLEVVQKKAKNVFKHLNGPATPSELEELKAMGAPAPLVYLLSRHNGSKFGFETNGILNSVAQIRAARQAMNELLEKKPKEFKEYWDRDFIPFIDQEDGQYYLIDPNAAIVPGANGQILYYDHETGPSRSLQSFDVWIDLVTKLANKGLLDESAFEDEEEEVEEAYRAIWAEMETVGLPRMTDQARNKALESLPNEMDSPEERLEGLRELVAEYGADEALLADLADAEAKQEHWEAALKARERQRALLPPKNRNSYSVVAPLVTALHRLGRDEEAIREYVSGAREEARNNPNDAIRFLEIEEVESSLAARAFDALLEVEPKAMAVWHALAKITEGDAQRRAAGRIVALGVESKTPSYNASNEAKLVIDAEEILVARLPAKERAFAFAEFVRAQSKVLSATSEYYQAFGNHALAAAQWELVLEAANMARYEGKGPIPAYSNMCALAVRAQFELGDERGALANLAATIGDDEVSLEEGFELLPWPVAYDKHPIPRLPPNARTPKHTAFERKCFEVLAKAQPKEPHWRYGIAACEEGAKREAALRETLALPSLKKVSWSDEKLFRLKQRVLVDLGATEEALKALKPAVADCDGDHSAKALVPFVIEEFDELSTARREYFIEAYWLIAIAHKHTKEMLNFIATKDPARRDAAVKHLVHAYPKPTEKKDPVHFFSSHVEALFEDGREDEALQVVEESLKRATKHKEDGRSFLAEAVPFEANEYVSFRSASEREAFLDKWFALVLPKFPDDAAMWLQRAKLTSDPKRRATYLDKATEHVDSPRTPPKWRKETLEGIQALR